MENLRLLSILTLMYYGNYLTRVKAVQCPSPSEKCDCSNANVGDVLCTGMNDVPRNLPSTTTFLNLDSNNIGPILLRIQMENVNELSLEELYLSGTGLEFIEPRCFSEQPSLRVLDLGRNDLEWLDDETFSGLDQLTTLLLTETSLREISRGLFSYTPSLKWLDLNGNELTAITSEFTPLMSLEVLLLASNKIETMDKNALGNQELLRRLDLYDNDLQYPIPTWFDALLQNDGTVEFSVQGYPRNPWECCSRMVAFRKFYDSIQDNNAMRDKLDVECASPTQFQGLNISEISTEELEATPCENATTVSATNATTDATITATRRNEATASMNDTEDNVNVIFSSAPMTTTNNNATNTGTFSKSATPLRRLEKVTDVVIIEPENFMRHLTDVQIAVVFFLVAMLAALITAIIAFKHNSHQKKKSLDSFLHNLPNCKDVDSDEEGALTTRTYRQDVAVYGSAGQVIDRHRSGLNSSPDDTSSEGSGRYGQVQKRKPPPYVPPGSPDDAHEDIGSQQENNSSSVTIERSRQRSGAFNQAFESDSSSDEDVWDINTMK